LASISVVIPTRKRPELVLRAIRSVLAQSYREFEIVVVIDGPDAATVEALRQVGDERLRWLALAESAGGSEARNEGIRASNGHWVALLDDDDEWSPTKLDEQIAEAKTARPDCLIVTRYIDSKSNAQITQPAARPKPGQPVSEYLFCETSLLGFRKGFLQTSTWLAPRQVFLDVPFTKGLPRNQDTDWLLRAVPSLDLDVRVVWKPLAIFHNESSVGRITSKSDWRDTINWAVDGKLFTRKALFFFLATVCIPAAKVQGEPLNVFWTLAKLGFRDGKPTLRGMWLFFACWFVFPYGRFGLRSKLQNFINLRGRKISEVAK